MGAHQQNPIDAPTHGSARPLVTLRRIAARRIARVLILGRFSASEVLEVARGAAQLGHCS
jgi:hypothetical protein